MLWGRGIFDCNLQKIFPWGFFVLVCRELKFFALVIGTLNFVFNISMVTFLKDASHEL